MVSCNNTIIANNDIISLQTGNSSNQNILSNDKFNNLPVNNSIVSITMLSSSNPGITLNTTSGNISVSATVPYGIYTLTYKICSISCPNNCSVGTVTINVCNTPIPNIVANNDTVNYSSDSRKVNLLDNDIFNSATIPLNNLNISTEQIPFSTNPIPTNGGFKVSSNGFVSPFGTITGTYTIQYRIKYSGSCPTLSNIATVTITVN